MANTGTAKPAETLARRAHRRQPFVAEAEEDPGSEKTRLKRTCLNCKLPFDSAWAGERICPRCKGTTVWRSGASAVATTLGQPQSRSGRKGGS